MNACEHIDTEEDVHGNIRCVQKDGCGKLVGRVATKAMANAAITYLGKQRVQDLDDLNNNMIRGMIDAALTVQPIDLK